MKKSWRTRNLAMVLSLILAFGAIGCGDGAAQTETKESAPAASAGGTESGSKKEPAGVAQKIVCNAVESPSYDPIRDTQTGEVVSHMFEGLTCWSQGELVLGQAESIECSEDSLTYTIKLREDICWSDGKPVTAQDFAYSWLRELKPETAAKFVSNLYIIKNAAAYNKGEADAGEVGIQVVDDRHLIVTMEAPVTYFEELLAFKCYLPVREDIVEANGENWSLAPETCVGNGPFRMTEYTPGEKMLLKKSDTYYGASDIRIEELEVRFLTDASVELMSYQTGEIQIAVKPSAETCAQYPNESMVISKLSTMWLVPNLEDEVLSDVRVRQALSMAIDRQTICDNILKGGEEPAYSIVPKAVMDPVTGESFAAASNFEENAEKARQLLAEAGYPGGEGFPSITYGTSSGAEFEEVAQAIAAMWKANLGIEISIEVEDSSAFIAHRSEGYFDVARYTMAGTYADPIAPLSLYIGGGSANDSNYKNPAYDELLETARNSSDPAEKFAAYHQLDQMLIDDVAVIPLYYPSLKYLVKPNVKNVGVNYLGMLEFKSAYVEAQ